MLTKYKKLAESVLEPAVKSLAKANPNVITLLGSIPSLLFFVAVLHHHYLIALLTSVLHMIDMLDGMIARKYHKVTAFGGFLDSTIDRVSDFFIITAFAFGGIVRWEIVAPLLLAAFLTSYIRSRGELAKPEVSFAVGIVERTERLIGIFLSLALYMIIPTMLIVGLNVAEFGLVLLTILSIYTVLQRIGYAYKKL